VAEEDEAAEDLLVLQRESDVALSFQREQTRKRLLEIDKAIVRNDHGRLLEILETLS